MLSAVGVPFPLFVLGRLPSSSLTQRSNLITSFLIGPTHHQGPTQRGNRPIRLFAMADIADPNAQHSPAAQDDATGNGNGADNRGAKRPRVSTAADEDDEDDDKPGRERRKIDIKFIQDKSRRHITFSKRKAGIMKKVRSALSPNSLRRMFIASPYVAIGPCSRCSIANRSIGNQLGVRVISPDRHPSSTSRRFRNWTRLHLHNAKAPTFGHQG